MKPLPIIAFVSAALLFVLRRRRPELSRAAGAAICQAGRFIAGRTLSERRSLPRVEGAYLDSIREAGL
jgi:hypothetical protein